MSIQLPSEIFTQIIQSALITDASILPALNATCTLFASLTKTTNCLAALYIGMYSESVYANIISKHESDATPSIFNAISVLREQPIPNGVYHLYKSTINPNPKTLQFLSTRCKHIDESIEFMELFNEYVSATKIEGGIADRTKLIKSLNVFLLQTQFIPAYTSASRIFFILENLPVCLFEESKEIAILLCQNSGLESEDLNARIVAKIMWDYGYLREWSSSSEMNNRINNVMAIGGFALKGRAVQDIIRRNTWVNWSKDLLERVSQEDLVNAVKIVIEEQLKRQSGGGYMVAQRLASTYSIPAQFVDATYKKVMSL